MPNSTSKSLESAKLKIEPLSGGTGAPATEAAAPGPRG